MSVECDEGSKISGASGLHVLERTDFTTTMPSLVVMNLINLVLNLTICQIGLIYYENKVLSGGLMHRSLGKQAGHTCHSFVPSPLIIGSIFFSQLMSSTILRFNHGMERINTLTQQL